MLRRCAMVTCLTLANVLALPSAAEAQQAPWRLQQSTTNTDSPKTIRHTDLSRRHGLDGDLPR
jgi:hypothetical protein